MALKPAVGAFDLGGPHVDLRAVPFEQLEAPAAADGIRDPRADQGAEQAGEDDPGHREVVA